MNLDDKNQVYTCVSYLSVYKKMCNSSFICILSTLKEKTEFVLSWVFSKLLLKCL